MKRTRIELRYALVSECIEALKPMPLGPHEAVAAVINIGLDALRKAKIDPEDIDKYEDIGPVAEYYLHSEDRR